VPHDSWVVGETRHVSLYLLGADEYAKEWRGRWRRLASRSSERRTVCAARRLSHCMYRGL